MSAPPRKRSSPLLTTLFVVTVLVIGYPLSLGPAFWFYDHGFLPEPLDTVAETFYSPIAWVDDTGFFETNPVGRLYWSYVDWWQE